MRGHLTDSGILDILATVLTFGEDGCGGGGRGGNSWEEKGAEGASRRSYGKDVMWGGQVECVQAYLQLASGGGDKCRRKILGEGVRQLRRGWAGVGGRKEWMRERGRAKEPRG